MATSSPYEYDRPARYIVIQGKAADGIVVVEKRPFPFVHKAYSLVPKAARLIAVNSTASRAVTWAHSGVIPRLEECRFDLITAHPRLCLSIAD